MTSPCTKESAIDFLVDNAKDTKKSLEKLVEITVDNAIMHENIKKIGEDVGRIDKRLEKVEDRPAKYFKNFLTVFGPVVSAGIIYWLWGG